MAARRVAIPALALACLLAAPPALRAAPAADQIKELPGWEGPLPSKQYSGFLDASPQHHLHYVFVEAEREPAKAPVVLWLNGGPGASSFGYGYLTELGPLSVETDNATALRGDGLPPRLVRNPHAFTTVANVLFLESPSNVGFSFCGSPTAAKAADCGMWTDTSTAALNFAALKAFFAKFPELSSNPFWIWGESYAGVYIPMLADTILNATTAQHAEAQRPRAGAVPALAGIVSAATPCRHAAA